MPSEEALLNSLANKLTETTEAMVRFEVTLATEMKGVREDLTQIRETLKDVTHTQRDHGDRLTANETRIHELQDRQIGVANIDTRLSVLEERVNNNAPVRSPWTAIVASVVAAISLAWAVFGP